MVITAVDVSSSSLATLSQDAERFGLALHGRRIDRGWRRRQLAGLSGGRWTARALAAVERGDRALSDADVADLAALYEVDISSMLGARAAFTIEPGRIQAGGQSTGFIDGDADSLLRAYLLLVRKLRGQEQAPIIELRRRDIDVLSAYLGLAGHDVVDRLGELMGATAAQRRAMGMLFTTGIAVIGVTAASLVAGSSFDSDISAHLVEKAQVTVVSTTDLTPANTAQVSIERWNLPHDAPLAIRVTSAAVTEADAAAAPAPTTESPVTTVQAATPQDTVVRADAPASAGTPADVVVDIGTPAPAPTAPTVDTGLAPVPVAPIIETALPPVPAATMLDTATPPVPTAPVADTATPPVP